MSRWLPAGPSANCRDITFHHGRFLRIPSIHCSLSCHYSTPFIDLLAAFSGLHWNTYSLPVRRW